LLPKNRNINPGASDSHVLAADDKPHRGLQSRSSVVTGQMAESRRTRTIVGDRSATAAERRVD